MKFSSIWENFLKSIYVFLTLIVFLIPTLVEASIYVCIDKNNIRHYSDKKCPVENHHKTEVMNDLGQVDLPKSVLEFTPIIHSIKRSLSLMKQRHPEIKLYQQAYQYAVTTENEHRQFVANRHTSWPSNYNPFNPSELATIITVISYGCRGEGYMTICGVIEGNPWTVEKERLYVEERNKKGIEYILSSEEKENFCEKAKTGNQGGVISRKMLGDFCPQ